jgi:drug/metabolite transporter (DMT)-like permease
MIGALLALLTATLVAISDVLCRALFQKARWIGDREVAGLRLLLAAPLLLALMPSTGGPAAAAPVMWLIVLGVPLEIVALLAYMRAIRTAPLSLVLPLLAVTPVLLLITGPLVAGEPWSARGVPGVALVVAGLWLVGLGQSGSGPLAPVRALMTTPATRAMLLTACCYSVTAALGKRGAVTIGPVTMAVWYYLVLAAAVVGLSWAVRGHIVRATREHPWLALGIGIAYALHLLTHMAAMALIPAAQMVACKRSSVLLAPLLARVLLGEALPRQRLLAIVLMVAGAGWIVLASA